MFDNFFSHYDLLIAPTHRSNTGILSSSKSAQRMQRTNTSPIKTAEEICGDTYKNLYYNEKKKNMVLRHENSKLKEKLKELTAQALSLSEEIYKEKINNDRSADHIIKLEKVIQKIKYSNPKSLRTQQSKPSILKHHSSSHNLNNISTRIRSNNNNNTSTYRTSKRNTTDFDLNTNNNNNNININLTTSTTSNPSNNVVNSDLLKELEKLRQFKDNIFTLSLTCDDINSNVFKCFDNVTKLLIELNSKFYSNINDDKVFTLYDFEFNQYKLIHCSLQDIVNTMKRFLQFKQDEYVILIEEKNNEIKELQCKLKNKEEFIMKQKNEIFDVNVQSEQLKNEIVLLNQLKKTYLDAQFGEQKQNIKQIGRNGNSEYNSNVNQGNNNNSFSDELHIMKNSVSKSLKRIERTFQEDNPVKKELIDKMKNI
jgi:hypothetical protein